MFTLSLILIGTACFVATTPIANDPFTIVSSDVSPSSRLISFDKSVDKILSFWTDDKLKAAKSVMPIRKINSQTTTKTEIPNNGPRVLVDGTMGSLQKAAISAAVNPDKASSRQVFTSTGRQTYTTGKIFWNNTGNSYGMCSGAIVTSNNKDTIVTAGHCCFDHDTNKFRISQNFIFIPDYKSGAQPYGKWAARTMTAYTAWTVNQNFNYDVCFVNLYTNSKGQHIQDLLGAEGIGSNYPRNAITYSFGYPYNLAQGEIMQYCSGSAAASKYGNGYTGQTIPCDMTGGCSGGPWIQNFTASTGVGYITSLNSFLITTIPNYMNGPYFESNIWSLYQKCMV
ncbi:unnamed protein product [Adineta steineri]|uniref:Serine protease n=1 Tax=Adineta steineri TaxID=433720 RepID=A0A814QW02_9BILA|nr:unnamed protein product [Adineta steineri]CAF1123520.1 unnamed protein product [Adineta steineri]